MAYIITDGNVRWKIDDRSISGIENLIFLRMRKAGRANDSDLLPGIRKVEAINKIVTAAEIAGTRFFLRDPAATIIEEVSS
jgi:hypothetical protein